MLLCLSLAACGGGSKKPSPRKNLSQSSTGSATASGSSNRPLATIQYVAAADPTPQRFNITIYDLRRDGPYLVLDFGVTCLQIPSAGCSTEFTFAPEHNSSEDTQVPSGVYVVDPVGNREYLPVRDSQRRPFTSTFPVGITDSRTYLQWVRYPAPPASVTSLDVTFPDGGPQIPSVPISSGSGPTAGGSLVGAQPARFPQPPTSTDTSGLTLSVENLVETVGNRTGSDAESATQATVTLSSDVLFRFAKSDLTSAAHRVLATVASRIKSRASGPVQVTGYTDSIGSDAVNIPLSQARARAVLGALQPLTPGVRYTAFGRGSADPVAPNSNRDGSDNPAGRALNRRVTITFAVKARAKPSSPPAVTPAPSSPSSASPGQSIPFTVGNHLLGTSSYQSTVNSLFREGGLLVLRMTITCTHSTHSGGACNTELDLAGIDAVPPLSLGDVQQNTYFSISGFYLVDPASGTEYIPLHGTDTNPITGDIGVGDHHAGDSYQVWAYFPAPPPSVSTLTLITPTGAKLAGVPISASPPAQS